MCCSPCTVAIFTYPLIFSAPPAPAHAQLSLNVVDGVGVIRVDTPGSKVNTLSIALQDQFENMLNQVNSDPNITSAVLVSAKSDCFIAGADIK